MTKITLKPNNASPSDKDIIEYYITEKMKHYKNINFKTKIDDDHYVFVIPPIKYTPRWKQRVYALLHPSTWCRILKYDFSHDIEIQKLLQTEHIEIVDEYLARFSVSKREIWTRNYSFGFWWDQSVEDRLAPSRHTCYLLKKEIYKTLKKM